MDFRSLYALIGVGLHIGIWATMEVGPFTWVSLTYYICFFSPDEMLRARRWIGKRLPALA